MSGAIVIAEGVFGGGLEAGERLRITICDKFVTLLVWEGTGADMVPTDRGMSLPISALPWLSDAICGALDYARCNGQLGFAWRGPFAEEPPSMVGAHG